MPRREPTPSYGAIARAVGRSIRRRKRRGHGPLGRAIPGSDLGPRKAWRGGVVRLEQLTDAERLEITGGRARTDPAYRPTSVGIVRCPTCQHWRDENPAGVCSTCGIYSIPR